MKKICITYLFVALSSMCFGQISPQQINNLKLQLLKARHDSSRGRLALMLAQGYRFSNIDSSLFYADLSFEIAKKLKLTALKAVILSLKGATLLESGRLPESLQFQFEALKLSEEIRDNSTKAYALNRIGNTYMELADYRKANEYYFMSKDLFQAIRDTGMYHNEVSNIGNVYELMQVADSALYYQTIVYTASLNTKDRDNYTRPEIMFRMGNAYKLNGNIQKALSFYKNGMIEGYIDNDLRNLSWNSLLIAKLYKDLGQADSSLKYAYSSLQTGKTVSFRKGMYEASMLLSDVFKNDKKFDSAYKYLYIANTEKDSLTGAKRLQELQRIILNEQERILDSEARRIEDYNKQKQYALTAGLGIFLIIATILYRNNTQKQKTNTVLETTLKDLKSTQSQLIQSEKMASLGELTAGIAHEIQNPLNFVNNFSEVNKELLTEMREEMDKGNLDDAKAIANDVIDNEEKINHHGKRADAIVKGMLQHSQSGSGKKEPTDINKLADEYLRLAYHGLRTKDKSFNATMKTDFDEAIGNINIVPQDFGRVILNLITNAFYVVAEKNKLQPEGYEPKVSVSTKKTNSHIQIIVQDNGNGIPQKVLDKIFQPFFTTKPTGQGTGLGLSLAYDIVKAHGGELRVETKVGERTAFTIELPIN